MSKDVTVREEDLFINPELWFTAIAAEHVLDKRITDSEFRTYCCLLSMCPISKTIDSNYNEIVEKLVDLLWYRELDVCTQIMNLRALWLINIEEEQTIKITFKS